MSYYGVEYRYPFPYPDQWAPIKEFQGQPGEMTAFYDQNERLTKDEATARAEGLTKKYSGVYFKVVKYDNW